MNEAYVENMYYDKVVDDIKYFIEKSVNDGPSRAQVVSCGAKSAKEIVIPPTVDGIPVTRIGHFAFSHTENLESIVLPDTIESIAEFAFEHSGIKRIKLPKDLISLGPYSLHDCNNLESVEFNENIRHIEMFAFNRCESLKNIDIPQSLKFLHISTFHQCTSLERINIKSDDFKIMPGESGFGNVCPNLKTITVNDKHPDYKIINGALYDYKFKELIRVPPKYSKKSFSFPKWVQSAERYAFNGVNGIESVHISQPKIGGLTDSHLHLLNLSRIYCEPDSFVNDWAKDNRINTEPLNSRMNDFLDSLVPDDKSKKDERYE